MKKHFYLTLLLTFVAIAVSARDYPVRITGIRVTDTNCNNIRGQYITSGHIKYIDSTRTLEFNGVTMGNLLSHTPALIQTDSAITIKFIGVNNLLGHSCLPMIDFHDTVEIVSTSDAVINIEHYVCDNGSLAGSITVHAPVHINTSAPVRFVHHSSGQMSNKPLLVNLYTYTDLRISSRNVKFIGSKCPISGFNHVIMDSLYYTYPRNTYYDTNTAELKNPIYLLDSVVISDEYSQPYLRPVFPVKVAGTQVTVLNADSVVGNGISGHVSFDSLSNTLILDNATIGLLGQVGILCDSSISIRCIGYNFVDGRNENNIAGSTMPMLLRGANFNIYGSGSENDTLQLSTYRQPVIAASNNISFRDMTLLTYLGNCITMYDTSTPGNITINNSNVKILSDQTNGPISKFNNLILRQCQIVRPAGFHYSTANRRIEDSTGNTMRYMDTLVIEKSPVGLQTASKDQTKLVPNPVSTNLHVYCESAISRLQIIDTYGRLIKTLTPNTKHVIVNVRDLKNGIYTLKIHSENGTTARQFVVKH